MNTVILWPSILLQQNKYTKITLKSKKTQAYFGYLVWSLWFICSQRLLNTNLLIISLSGDSYSRNTSCTLNQLSVIFRSFKHILSPDYKIAMCCFSIEHSVLRSKSANNDWLVIRLMFPTVATCIFIFDNCSSSTIKTPAKLVDLVKIGHPHNHFI